MGELTRGPKLRQPPARGQGRARPSRVGLAVGLTIIVLLVPLGVVVGILAHRSTDSNDDGFAIAASPTAAATASPAPTAPSITVSAPAASPPPAPPTAPAVQSTGPVPTVEPTAGAGTAPAATVTPAAAVARMVVVNAAPDGVRLRSEPGDGEPLTILSDGTEIDSLGETREVDGRTWLFVREATGRRGWVATDYVAAVQPSPTPTTVATMPPPTQTPRPEPTARPATPTTASAPIAPPALTATPSRAAAPTPTVTAIVVPTRGAALPAPTAARPTATTPPSAPRDSDGGNGRAAPRGRICPPTHPIKGNHSSSGEWIYHPPGGQFYSRTIPEDCFATESDARAAGYRASKR